MGKWTTFDEMMARMPEEERRKVEELSKILIAEEEFWNSLPEAEKNKRLEKPKVSYCAASDTLWLMNGRPTPRCYDILANRVTVFFEADIWYPSAVMVGKASRLLGPIFGADDVRQPESMIIRRGRGDCDKVEKFLNLDGVEIDHENMGDCLWIGNGELPCDGTEFAEDLVIYFTEENQIPVGVTLTPAAKLLTPLLFPAGARAASGMV